MCRTSRANASSSQVPTRASASKWRAPWRRGGRGCCLLAVTNQRRGPPWTKFGRGAAALISLSCRSEEHTSELQSLMRISYAVFCLKKKIYLDEPTHSHSAQRNH